MAFTVNGRAKCSPHQSAPLHSSVYHSNAIDEGFPLKISKHINRLVVNEKLLLVFLEQVFRKF
jgi:hypothetical protein